MLYVAYDSLIRGVHFACCVNSVHVVHSARSAQSTRSLHSARSVHSEHIVPSTICVHRAFCVRSAFRTVIRSLCDAYPVHVVEALRSGPCTSLPAIVACR